MARVRRKTGDTAQSRRSKRATAGKPPADKDAIDNAHLVNPADHANGDKSKAIDNAHKATHSSQPLKRTRYSEDDKHRAVTAMLTANFEHPMSDASIRAAQAILNIPIKRDTLYDWIDTYGDKIRPLIPRKSAVEIVTETHDAVVAKWTQARDLLLDTTIDRLHDPAAAAIVPIDKAMTGAGIAQDKLDKMQGLSPEIRQSLAELSQACTLANLDLAITLRDIAMTIKDRVAQITPPSPLNLIDKGEDKR